MTFRACVTAAFLGVAGVSPLLAQQGPFILKGGSRPGTGGGSQPVAVVTANLNADNFPDCLVVRQGNNDVYAFVGDGRGGLSGVGAWGVGATPVALATADLNKDGKADAVTADYFGNSVTVLLGNGQGGLQPQTPTAVSPRPRGIALGDVNGDGNVDALVVLQNLGQLEVLLGDGQGILALVPGRTTVGTKARDVVVVGDINGDGKTDAVALAEGDGSSPGQLVPMLGNGAGGFTAGPALAAQVSCARLLSGRFNGDAYPDVVVANAGSHTVTIFLGQSNGSFTVRAHLPVQAQPMGMSLGDLDSDSKQDIVVACSGANQVELLLGDGQGGFGGPIARLAGTGSGPEDVAVVDLDNDGLVDAVTADRGSDAVAVLLNDPVQANRIKDISISPGSWSNGTFVASGRRWDTQASCPDWNGGVGWALAVTDPAPAAPVKNRPDSSIDLPVGRYWLHGDQMDTLTVLQAGVQWFSDVVDIAQFSISCPDVKVPALWRLGGSSKIELGTTGVTGGDLVNRCNMGPSGSPEHVFDVTVYTQPQTPKPVPDWIHGVLVEPGDYYASTGTFLASGVYWDTDPSCPDWNGGRGWMLEVTQPSPGQPRLNCANGRITLAPDQTYYLYADPNLLSSSSAVRVTTQWASGASDQAVFSLHCPETIDDPQWNRLAGSPKIEFGHLGTVPPSDRVNRCNFGNNGVTDQVFIARLLTQPPPPGKQQDWAVGLSIEPGSYSTQTFIPSGRYWDADPGCPDWNGGVGWVLGVTIPSLGSPVLNCGWNTRVSLPSGNYLLYADPMSFNTAVRVTVDWAIAGREQAVFSVGSLSQASQWAQLEGSKNIELWSTGVQNQLDRVNRCSLGANGVWDEVLDLRLLSNAYTTFGLGCQGSAGVPALAVKSPPAIGMPFQLAFNNLRPSTTLVATLGMSCTSYAGVPLPFDFTPLGATGCKLYISLDVAMPITTGNGAATWGFTMPANPYLKGWQIYNQGIVLDPGANTLGLAFSNAGGGRIGG